MAPPTIVEQVLRVALQGKSRDHWVIHAQSLYINRYRKLLSDLHNRHLVVMMHPRVPLTGEPDHVYRSRFSNHGRLASASTLP